MKELLFLGNLSIGEMWILSILIVFGIISILVVAVIIKWLIKKLLE